MGGFQDGEPTFDIQKNFEGGKRKTADRLGPAARHLFRAEEQAIREKARSSYRRMGMLNDVAEGEGPDS